MQWRLNGLPSERTVLKPICYRTGKSTVCRRVRAFFSPEILETGVVKALTSRQPHRITSGWKEKKRMHVMMVLRIFFLKKVDKENKNTSHQKKNNSNNNNIHHHHHHHHHHHEQKQRETTGGERRPLIGKNKTLL